jgi:hypothetical protein
MENIGRILVVAGLFMAIIGLLVMAISKIGIPFGRLPGDIVIHKKNFTFYFPLATSIILSVLFSILYYIISRFHK